MNHKELIYHCVASLCGFDKSSKYHEDHINRYLKYQVDLTESEQLFIVDVFSGCVKFDSLLKVVTNGFFNKDGKTVLRSEENIYLVFSYLTLFRLDTIGISEYSRFVWSQNLNKIYQFLRFITNDKHIRTWMKDEWNKIYDYTFVETNILEPLLRWIPELNNLFNRLQEKSENKNKISKKTIKATEPTPFKLTEPKPRSIPVPQPIPHVAKHKPVPKHIFNEPKEFNNLTKLKETNRRKAESQLMSASKNQFACANPEKSEKTKRRMQTVLSEDEAKLDFDSRKSNPLSSAILSSNVPIKLNTAAILREGKFYKNKEDEEMKKLERLFTGAKDSSDFLKWQSNMRQSDLDKELAEIERRRIEGKLSHEEAILARQKLIHENKTKVEQMKQDTKKMMDKFLKKKLENEKQMRELVEIVINGHENAKEAKIKLKEYKAQIVQEMNEKNQELMKQALEDAEAEMKQKIQLIHQIRAMEATPIIREKFVDLTETAGHGLLNEMSIAELRERLSLLKVTEAKEEDQKRDEIIASKRAKDQYLTEMLNDISRHRLEKTRMASIKVENKKRQGDQKEEIKDEKLLELRQKLEEKKSARLQQQEALKIKPDKKSANRIKVLSKAKQSAEESRWQELEQTRERTAALAARGANTSFNNNKYSRSGLAIY